MHSGRINIYIVVLLIYIAIDVWEYESHHLSKCWIPSIKQLCTGTEIPMNIMPNTTYKTNNIRSIKDNLSGIK